MLLRFTMPQIHLFSIDEGGIFSLNIDEEVIINELLSQVHLDTLIDRCMDYGDYTIGHLRAKMNEKLKSEIHMCMGCSSGEPTVQVLCADIDDRTGLCPHEESSDCQFRVICNAQRGGCGSSSGVCDSHDKAVRLWNRLNGAG
jgi:hypothetical protein